MSRIADIADAGHLRDPGPGAPMTREELGDHLAHMVWESLSDLLVSEDGRTLFEALEVPVSDGLPRDPAAEELLIFFLWSHARAIGWASAERPDRDPLSCILSALHRAVYHDLEAYGIPATELPLFEQRVGARYFGYHHAAATSPLELGRAAATRISPVDRSTPEAAEILARRSLDVSEPLRDFLEDLQIVSPEPTP